ncbi:ATP-dependent DNA helicase yku80, partial [Friedmanniomyces endolithicus]
MASKEATVYIVDCGSTMGERSHGRKQTNLDFALEYVWDRITATIATGRKTAMAGVVGLRTDGTRNDLNGEDDYAHITVFQDISQMLMSQVRKLRNELVLSSTPGGDAISAIIVAIQMIAKECKKLKYERKIVLVTDARGPMQTDDLSDIIPKLKEDEIQLVVIGVDFDDAEYGFKEENKDATKGENEAGLRQICSDCGGAFGTLAQAVDELGIPRVKSTKPVASYKGFLTLGNPEQYETAMAIDIERYPKIMAATTPSA